LNGRVREPPGPHESIHANENEKEDKEKMSDREQYTPGAASGARIRKDGEKWTLILVRELRHQPAMVWQALTDPAHLREWAYAGFAINLWGSRTSSGAACRPRRRAPDRAPPAV
jgi:hypothetical protein